jgi:hypothetical protein
MEYTVILENAKLNRKLVDVEAGSASEACEKALAENPGYVVVNVFGDED